jgi:hypothetical protein
MTENEIVHSLKGEKVANVFRATATPLQLSMPRTITHQLP